jgi:hypothetical protein
MSNPCGPENLVRLNRKFKISGANLFSYYCWWAKHLIRVTRNFNLNVFEITRVDCIYTVKPALKSTWSGSIECPLCRFDCKHNVIFHVFTFHVIIFVCCSQTWISLKTINIWVWVIYVYSNSLSESEGDRMVIVIDVMTTGIKSLTLCLV